MSKIQASHFRSANDYSTQSEARTKVAHVNASLLLTSGSSSTRSHDCSRHVQGRVRGVTHPQSACKCLQQPQSLRQMILQYSNLSVKPWKPPVAGAAHLASPMLAVYLCMPRGLYYTRLFPTLQRLRCFLRACSSFALPAGLQGLIWNLGGPGIQAVPESCRRCVLGLAWLLVCALKSLSNLLCASTLRGQIKACLCIRTI